MARADSSRVAMRWLKERTAGTTPAEPMTNVRFVSEALAHTKETVVSAEIRDDRQVPDIVEVGTSAGGDISVEMQFKEYDQFFEGVLQGTFVTETYTGAGIAGDVFFEGDPYNRIHTPKDKFPNLKVGMYLKAGGATNTGNNSYFKVTAITRNTNNKDVFTVDGPLTEEDSSTATIIHSSLRNGTTKNSFTLEKEFKDVARFFSFTGMVLSRMAMDLRSRQIATAVFSFMGRQGASAAATVGTGAAVAAGAQDIMNASHNVGSIQEGGAALATGLQQITYTVENNLREQSEVGTKNVTGMGSGRFVATGRMTAYFENANLFTKFLNHTKSSLHFRLVDTDGDRYFFDFPHVKFTADPVQARGNDQDVMEEIDWQALLDVDTGITMQISKFTASN